jgi:hypothetical protein
MSALSDQATRCAVSTMTKLASSFGPEAIGFGSILLSTSTPHHSQGAPMITFSFDGEGGHGANRAAFFNT